MGLPRLPCVFPDGKSTRQEAAAPLIRSREHGWTPVRSHLCMALRTTSSNFPETHCDS